MISFSGLRDAKPDTVDEAARMQLQMFREKTYAAGETLNGIARVLSSAHDQFKAAQEKRSIRDAWS